MSLPRFLKRPTISLFERAGLTDWLPAYYREMLPEARQLRRLFRERRVDVVIDVGANCGQYAQMLRYLVGYSGWIVSVEPNPASADELMRRMAGDARWELLPVALGREAGVLPLRITRSSLLSSFRQTNENCSKWFNKGGEVERVIDVPVRTLASVLDEIRSRVLRPTVYLKLDTQGFDQEILESSRESLVSIAALQTELSFQPIYEEMTKWDRVTCFLEDREFRLSALWPVASDSSGALIEADGLFVNTAWKSE